MLYSEIVCQIKKSDFLHKLKERGAEVLVNKEYFFRSWFKTSSVPVSSPENMVPSGWVCREWSHKTGAKKSL